MTEHTTIDNYLWVLSMASLCGLVPLHSQQEKQLVSNIQHFFKKWC